MESYIDCKKKLYHTILEFLDESEKENQEIFEELCDNMRNIHIEGDREEMRHFLLTIKSISDNHHRNANFNQKIKKILQHFGEQIKQTLSNYQIFQIFAKNKLIVLLLLKNDIITITNRIYNRIINIVEPNGNRYCHFFYPELEKFKGEEEMKSIKEEILTINETAFENYEEKRQEGENESHICSLIRKDSIDEFISYINFHNISVSSEINPSIFETNSFLNENKHTTLIEYSAFFGSIRIFQYLFMNKVELTSSLWLYSIHSNNAELIDLLESNRIFPPEFMNNNESKEEIETSYLICLIESIKCHHNEFAKCIANSFISEQEKKSTKTNEEIITNILKYHNYSYFQMEYIEKKGFFYLCFYKYNKVVDLLLKSKEEEINKKVIFFNKYFHCIL